MIKNAAPCEGAAGGECVRTNANEVQNRGDLLLSYDFEDVFEDVIEESALVVVDCSNP